MLTLVTPARAVHAVAVSSLSILNSLQFTAKATAVSTSTYSNIGFNPTQILCIEHDEAFLYAELIQVIEPRQLCWLRPVLLAKGNLDGAIETGSPNVATSSDKERYELIDLRQSSDLLWPVGLIRAALDVEVIPLLAKLGAVLEAPELNRAATLRLQEFVRQVWQTYPDMFAN